jgi:hypothetical protein
VTIATTDFWVSANARQLSLFERAFFKLRESYPVECSRCCWDTWLERCDYAVVREINVYSLLPVWDFECEATHELPQLRRAVEKP